MSDVKKVTINGREYDARTGMALDTSVSIAPAPTTPHVTRVQPDAHHVHTPLQRSQTLNRHTTHAPHHPAAATSNHTIIVHSGKPRAHQPSSPRSPHITKFTPHPVVTPAQPVADIAPMVHPHVHKAHTISKIKAESPLPDTAPKHLTSQEIKRSAMQQAIHNTSANHHQAKIHLLKRHPRALSIVSVTLGLVLLGSYFTYINMPNLSTRVAAAEAGINAQYPNYRPDGYSLSGLVGYSQDVVTMKFASNTGSQNFTLSQAKSDWDSTAVLDNFVAPRAGTNYIPYSEQGLTIYTYGNNAAWVNGGILYTIQGDAPLSSEQIRHIATSLI